MGFAIPPMIIYLFGAWLLLQVSFFGFATVTDCFRKRKANTVGEERVKSIILEDYRRLGSISWVLGNSSLLFFTSQVDWFTNTTRQLSLYARFLLPISRFSEYSTLFWFLLLVALWIFRDPKFVTGWASFFGDKRCVEHNFSVCSITLNNWLFSLISAVICRTEQRRCSSLASYSPGPIRPLIFIVCAEVNKRSFEKSKYPQRTALCPSSVTFVLEYLRQGLKGSLIRRRLSIVGLCNVWVTDLSICDKFSGEDKLRPAVSRSGLVTWGAMQRKFPWSVIMLLGGGFALAAGVKASNLSNWVGCQLQALMKDLPIPLIAAVFTTIITFMTEVSSNTATASIFIPIMLSVVRTTLFLLCKL